MTTHGELVQRAKDAIEALFADASVDREVTKADLEELIEDMESMIETIEEDGDGRG